MTIEIGEQSATNTSVLIYLTKQREPWIFQTNTQNFTCFDHIYIKQHITKTLQSGEAPLWRVILEGEFGNLLCSLLFILHINL